MSELFDTSGVRDDARRWDALAERVADAAMRRSREGGVRSIVASRAALIAASLLLAASLAFLTATSAAKPPRTVAELGQALVPTDDVGRSIVGQGGPPALGALLFGPPRVAEGQP